MMKITEEDGTEGEYPLTFICQIDCEDIAPFDKEGLLPHEGMLYFFAAIDEFIGYDSRSISRSDAGRRRRSRSSTPSR